MPNEKNDEIKENKVDLLPKSELLTVVNRKFQILFQNKFQGHK